MSVGGIGGPRGEFDVHIETPEAPAADAPRTVARAPGGSRRPVLATPASIESAVASDVYAAAKEVVARGPAAFEGLDEAGRARLAGKLERLIAQGAGSTRRTPRLADLRARSGAATVALALAKTLPAGDPIAARLVEAYVAQMKRETLKGLQASMALNLEASGIALTPTQEADLAAAKAKTMPAAPPYEEWFKNDAQVDVKHYIHPERWAIYTGGYRNLGFEKTEIAPDHWIFEKTFTDPTGKYPPTPVRIECRRTEEDTFRDMDDAAVDIELYSGHSNLGGNMLGALAEAPDTQKGAKWIINWMCRGKQVIADVQNRFPDAHYMTTDVAVNAYDGPKALKAIFEGIARRAPYREMDRDARLPGQLIFPDDPRALLASDRDQDGVVDVRPTGIDPLYDVAPRRELDGWKIMRAVSFFNTVFEYHHEHGPDGRTSVLAADRIHADGWFEGEGDEVCRIEERDGEIHVKVNAKYRDESEHFIGAALAYEVNEHLTRKHAGGYGEQDKLRGGLFAGLYVAYLVDTLEEAEETIAAVGEKYGFPPKFTWENVEKAIEADDHGYGSRTSQEALRRLLR